MAITNLNIAIVEQPSRHTSDTEFLEFLRAAQNGNIEALKRFLEIRPQDIDRADDLYSASATHFAAKNSQVEALRFLIDQGATLGNPGNYGFNELHYGFRNLEIAQLIIGKRPDLINSRSENGSALTLATYCKNFDVVSFLIEQNADVNITDENGNTAFHYLADDASNNVEIANSFIAKGANINALNRSGISILATAIGSGNFNISELLLQNPEIIIDDKARENLNLQLEAGSEEFKKIYASINPRSQTSLITVTRLASEIISAAAENSDSDSNPESAPKKTKISIGR